MTTVGSILSMAAIGTFYSIRNSNIKSKIKIASERLSKEPIHLNKKRIRSYYIDKFLEHNKSHYRLVFAKGKIQSDQYILFGPNKINSTTSGYYVISPFILKEDEEFYFDYDNQFKHDEYSSDIPLNRILVNRGWINYDQVDKRNMTIKNYKHQQSTSENYNVMGSLSPVSEVWGTPTINNSPNENKWFNLNLKEISKHFNTRDILINIIEEDDKNTMFNKFDKSNIEQHVYYNHDIIKTVVSKL